MIYQRKKRIHEQQEQLPVNTSQNNLFASPDLETDETDNAFSVDSSQPGPSLEVRRQQASKPFYNFGSPVPATTHAVQRQPSSPLVQAKLTVGPAGDKYEQEADQVASQVVDKINNPEASQPIQREMVHPSGKGAVQRMGEEELQMKPMIQRVGLAGGPIPNELEAEIQHEKGKGHALAPDLQQKMGQAMGTDLSGVKIHTDAKADQLNQAIQAKAFTTGNDVFFRQGEYNPSSRSGQELIAHEITHRQQQRPITNENSTIQRMPAKEAKGRFEAQSEKYGYVLDRWTMFFKSNESAIGRATSWDEVFKIGDRFIEDDKQAVIDNKAKRITSKLRRSKNNEIAALAKAKTDAPLRNFKKWLLEKEYGLYHELDDKAESIAAEYIQEVNEKKAKVEAEEKARYEKRYKELWKGAKVEAQAVDELMQQERWVEAFARMRPRMAIWKEEDRHSFMDELPESYHNLA